MEPAYRVYAPDGWHLPSDAEWETLINELGGTSVAGGELKETGTSHWNDPNTGATNNSGFSALPGGYRSDSGTFDLIGEYGYWWSATKTDDTHVWKSHYLSYKSVEVYSFSDSQSYGFSVRCVRD